MRPLVLAGVVVACSAGEVAAPAEPEVVALPAVVPEVVPEVAAPAAVTPVVAEPAELPAARTPWVWHHTLPEVLADTVSGIGVGPACRSHELGHPRRFVAAQEGAALVLQAQHLPEGAAAETEWERRVPGTGPAVVATAWAEPLVVALVFAEGPGYRVEAWTGDGTPRASARIESPGERPALQLQLWPERWAVFVRRPGGSHVDELDPATGALRARSVVPDDLLATGFAVPKDAARGRGAGAKWPGREGSYRVRHRRPSVRIERQDAKGSLLWQATTPDPYFFQDRFVVLEVGEVVLVATYNGASSGLGLHGFDRATGVLRYTADPGGIGMVGHSRYSNEVAIGVDAAGQIRVYGDESAGQYVATIDPVSGALRSVERWRR